MDRSAIELLGSAADMALGGNGTVWCVLFWIAFAFVIIGIGALAGWIDRLTCRRDWGRA